MSDENDAIISWLVGNHKAITKPTTTACKSTNENENNSLPVDVTLTDLQKELGVTKQIVILANIVMIMESTTMNATKGQQQQQQYKNSTAGHDGWNYSSITKHHQERFQQFQSLYNQKYYGTTAKRETAPLHLSPRMMIQNKKEQQVLKQKVFQFLETRANQAQEELEHALQQELQQQEQVKKKKKEMKKKKKAKKKKKHTNNMSDSSSAIIDNDSNASTTLSSASVLLEDPKPSSLSPLSSSSLLVQTQGNTMPMNDRSFPLSPQILQQKENDAHVQNRKAKLIEDTRENRKHLDRDTNFPMIKNDIHKETENAIHSTNQKNNIEEGKNSKEANENNDTTPKRKTTCAMFPLSPTTTATTTTTSTTSTQEYQNKVDTGLLLNQSPMIIPPTMTKTPPSTRKNMITRTPLSSPSSTIHNNNSNSSISATKATSLGKPTTTLEDVEQNEQVQMLLRAQRREHLEMIQQVQLKAFIAETQAAAAVDRAKQFECLLVDTLLKQATDEIINSILEDACITNYCCTKGGVEKDTVQ